MDKEELCTPQKTPTIIARKQHPRTAQFNCSSYRTPECKSLKSRSSISDNFINVTNDESNNIVAKPKNPVTMMQSISNSSGISSWESTNSNAMQMLGSMSNMPVVNTPPAKRFQQRVRNPFEAALAERLHLPLIASPSLFQIPSTPQLSSTQFEWTIEEVSSLLPAHVEPHETQFHDSPDSEYEAKAQMAISSYFKEQQIVPSPVDCPLRNQRIALSELNGNTPISKPGRRIRDIGTQTDLSLPFDLPKDLEDMLKKYLQPELVSIGKEWRGIGHRSHTKHTESLKDTSLRRKLFDLHNVVVLESDVLSPSALASIYPNKTEHKERATSSSPQPTTFVGKLSDSLDKSRCGSLSPISANEGLSFSHSPTPTSPTRRKVRMRDFCDELSPIVPLSQASKQVDKRSTILMNSPCNYRVTNSRHSDTTFSELTTRDDSRALSKNKFSPDRSSSPVPTLWCTTRTSTAAATNSIANYSTESFNVKVSRLAVDNEKWAERNESVIKVLQENEYLLHDETNDMLDDDDDMQVSQLSVLSSNCSSTNSDTPRKRRRTASRKNLSQSFSVSWLQAEEELEELEDVMQLPPKLMVSKASENATEVPAQPANATKSMDVNTERQCQQEKLGEGQRVNFYRTDSGFNEMTPCTSVLSSQEELSRDGATAADTSAAAIAEKLKEAAREANDVSMLSCCSTPTRDL